MTLKEYTHKYGITVTNSMGEVRTPSENNIPLENGRVISIVDTIKWKELNIHGRFSVGVSDYDGYFDWNMLSQFGSINGCIYCNTEDEIIQACEKIRGLLVA